MQQFGLLFLLAECVVAAGAAAPGSPPISDLFVADSGGYHTYRIPAMVVSTNGTVLVFCEGRKDSARDTGKIDLLLKRSTDGGHTWSDSKVVWADAGNVCGNPAPVVDRRTGIIWLLMTWNRGTDTEQQISRGTAQDTRHVFITSSADDGLTWAEPRDITSAVKQPGWHWYATGPVNGIQLERGEHKGRLVIPANHTETNAQNNTVSRAHIIYSDDRGKAWHIGGIEEELTNESTIVELSDGRLLHNMRSYHKQNRRAIATSMDSGASWSPLKLDPALIEPVCQGALLRCTWPESQQRSRILFSNPASMKRENLTLRLSYDEGATWAVSRQVYAGPAAYSCLAMLPNNSIACVFECGERNPYERIAFVTIPISSLKEPDKSQP